jgi:uncharacterized protein
VYSPRDAFRLNVGFIIHETIGYYRDFPFEFPYINLEPDLELRDLSGVARVTRTNQGLLVQVRLTAVTQAECVRCLEDASQHLVSEFTELFAFTRSQSTQSGLLVPENGKIDLEPLVREEMLLAVPINPLCRPDCQGLCPICGENLNQHPHEHTAEPVDEPWQAISPDLNADRFQDSS